ncbi:hypothetical protein [Pseudomonas sp. JV414]|uniref:hypothetical protein n=1 Tax=Pseudomonas sp. JV414 TaxID=1733110 RepID=UPI0028F3EC49|nr:hypothetical protein [Pseudomonas sp. JV414]
MVCRSKIHNPAANPIENGVGYSANGDPRRAGNESDDCANLGTHGAHDPLGGTTNGADKGADFPS